MQGLLLLYCCCGCCCCCCSSTAPPASASPCCCCSCCCKGCSCASSSVLTGDAPVLTSAVTSISAGAAAGISSSLVIGTHSAACTMCTARCQCAPQQLLFAVTNDTDGDRAAAVHALLHGIHPLAVPQYTYELSKCDEACCYILSSRSLSGIHTH
jgi:hypothetical protein